MMISCLSMSFRQLFIIKTKGCSKYCKLISLTSLRQYVIGTKNVAQKRKSAIVSSPAVASSPLVTSKLSLPLTKKDSEVFSEDNSEAKSSETTSLQKVCSLELSSTPSEYVENLVLFNDKSVNKSVKNVSEHCMKNRIVLFIPKANHMVEVNRYDGSYSGILHFRNSEQLVFTVNNCYITAEKHGLSLCNELLIDGILPSVNGDNVPEKGTELNAILPDNNLIKEDERPKLKLLNALKPEVLESLRPKIVLHLLPAQYMKLSKIRLTGLVVLTAVGGYAMAPSSANPLTLLCITLGTGLTSCAANAINQVLEVPYDSQMNRTKHRILVKGYLTNKHAVTFAVFSATLGLSLLVIGVNNLTAALGAFNLVLYTSVYTPMKRLSIFNTWVGSIVGAIPPMMGWAACTGTLDPGALLMGAILYAWQFPHFNALSWNLRSDYLKAGYRMMSVDNPGLCRRTTLRHSIAILALCSVAPLVDLTTWTFVVNSMPLNCYLVYCSWRFFKESDSASSRKLFRLSLVHLPALMLLMLISKKHYSKEKNDSEEGKHFL